MSNRKYPRIGAIEKRPKNTSEKCRVCNVVAKFRVDVQIDWFRGNDLVEWACDVHKNDAERLAADW